MSRRAWYDECASTLGGNGVDLVDDYLARAAAVISRIDAASIRRLADAIMRTWTSGHQVLLCGNGGSAANAEHFVNDLMYGVSPGRGDGVRAIALSSNPAVITCLGNDVGYDQIFSYQVAVLGLPGDLLLALSGSGNSPNILAALEAAHQRGLSTAAVVGFSGGRARTMADVVVHIPIDDMQISEDCMQLVGHVVTRRLAVEHKAGLRVAS